MIDFVRACQFIPGFMELFDFLAVFSGADLFLVLAMLNSDRVPMFLSFNYDIKGGI